MRPNFFNPYNNLHYKRRIKRILKKLRDKSLQNVYIEKPLRVFFSFKARTSGTSEGSPREFRYGLRDMLLILKVGTKLVEDVLSHKRGRFLFIGNKGASSGSFVKFARIAKLFKRKIYAYYSSEILSKNTCPLKGKFDTIYAPLITLVKLSKFCDFKSLTHDETLISVTGDYLGRDFYNYFKARFNGYIVSYYSATECPVLGLGLPEEDFKYFLYPQIYIPTLIKKNEFVDIIPGEETIANGEEGELAVSAIWNGFEIYRWRLGDYIRILDFPWVRFLGRTPSAKFRIELMGTTLTVMQKRVHKAYDLWFNHAQLSGLPIPTIALIDEKNRRAIFFVKSDAPSREWIDGINSIAYGFYRDASRLGIMKIYVLFDEKIFLELWNALQKGNEQGTVSRVIIADDTGELFEAIQDKVIDLASLE